jgi:hypothetical protein
MIHFLRKIRRSFINSNSIRKYLIYAIGEILLVVVGILIALQVNNWNVGQVESKQGSELKEKLYQELLEVDQWNKEIMTGVLLVQEKILKEFLTKGDQLNIDIFIIDYQDNKFVKLLSLPTYLTNFTNFYDPNFKLYKAAVSNGTISLIKDIEFVTALENIYINGPLMVERLYNREASSGKEMDNFIAQNYGAVFRENAHTEDGKWNYDVSKQFLEKAKNDGEFIFSLTRKLSEVQSKIFIIRTQINIHIENILSTYT